MVKQELIPAHVPLFLLFAPLLCAKELRSCCCCSSLQSKIKEKLGKILMFLCGFYFCCWQCSSVKLVFIGMLVVVAVARAAVNLQ